MCTLQQPPFLETLICLLTPDNLTRHAEKRVSEYVHPGRTPLDWFNSQ